MGGQGLGWEQWVLRAGSWEGGLGQILAKGPGWASWTLGPGDLDSSSPDSDSGESVERREAGGGTELPTSCSSNGSSGKDPQRRWRAVGGLQARQAGVCATPRGWDTADLDNRWHWSEARVFNLPPVLRFPVLMKKLKVFTFKYKNNLHRVEHPSPGKDTK